jgi:Fe-S-cluster-containing dehydrogenase component
MARYGMVVDLTKCIGCYGCMIACKQEHGIPPGIYWSRVLIKEDGTYPAVRKTIVPILCNHCEDAPCVEVCPSGASIRREDGIVTIDYDKCVGCRYCMMACPYGSRYFYDAVREYFPGQGLTGYERYVFERLQTGVVMKCNFCQDRIDEGVEKGMKPGIDRDATPACVFNCMAKARYFGDLDDPASEVSQLIKEKHGSRIHPEYGTEPSVYYIR